MRGAQVRGAGGLLVGVTVHPILLTLQYDGGYSDGIVDTFRNAFWYPAGYDVPADTIPFLALRIVLVFGGLVLGILGLAGLRPARIPIAVVTAVLTIAIVPWVIWPFDPVDFSGEPPEWVMEHPLWFPSDRGVALTLIAMLVASFVMALLDKAPWPATTPYPPGFGPPGPFGASGPPGAPGGSAGAGRWGPPPPGQSFPAPGPDSGPWPVPDPVGGPPGAPGPGPGAGPAPPPPVDEGTRRPPTPF
jgi:hypothetical protein